MKLWGTTTDSDFENKYMRESQELNEIAQPLMNAFLLDSKCMIFMDFLWPQSRSGIGAPWLFMTSTTPIRDIDHVLNIISRYGF